MEGRNQVAKRAELPILLEQKYSRLSPELRNHWAGLIQAGKFEEIKADLSLMSGPNEIASVNPKSLGDIFQIEMPTLATVKKYQGEAISMATIGLCLIAVNDFYGEKSGLSDGQIKMLSELIYSEFHYMTIADLKYCIKQGLLGKYEDKIYGKATPDVIMRWLNVHAEQRVNEAETIAIGAHNGRMKQQQEDIELGVLNPINAEEIAKKAKEIREAHEARFPKKERVWRNHYTSFEQYCEINREDSEKIRQQWRDEYNQSETLKKDIELGAFLLWRESEFINLKNLP